MTVLNNTGSGFSRATINDNFNIIKDELTSKVVKKVLGTGEDNTMQVPLDMNSNRILNMPAPIHPNDLVRKVDIGTFPVGESSYLTTTELISLSNTLAVGTVIETSGYITSGDSGGAKWVLTSVVNQTPRQNPLQLERSLFNDGDGKQWSLVYEYTIHLEKLGFISATAQERTALVQGLSDNLTNVELATPSGDYSFVASVLVESWPDNNGGTISASGCAVVMRQGVKYSGKGRNVTSWTVADPAVSIVYIDNGTDTEITGIEFKSTYTGVEAGAGHAIFGLVKALNDNVTNLKMHGLRCKNVASYGIGLNYGYQTHCDIYDFESDVTGGDGIDIKSRATSLLINNTNTIRKIRCKNFGLRLDGQSGLDVRGEYTIDDCWFTEFGDGSKLFIGLRLRPVSEANNLSVRTTATNIHAIAGHGTNTVGMQISGEANSVTGFSISDCDVGISVQESSECNVSSGVISGHNTYAIDTTVSAVDLNLTNIQPINAGTATHHFRIEGEGAVARAVDGDASAASWSISTAANATISRDSPRSRLTDGVDVYNITAGRVGIQAKGPSSNIDIAIVPKGTGGVRVGTHTAVGSETVTGFITIKDSSGVARKVAVIS